jgi:hypothetical protein
MERSAPKVDVIGVDIDTLRLLAQDPENPTYGQEYYYPQPTRWITQMFLCFCTGGPEEMGEGWKGLMNRFVAWRSQGM